MPNSFINHIANRRSIYALGNKLEMPQQEVISLIEEAVKYAPSAFNSQSSRAVILLENQHHRFWELVHNALQAIVPADKFAPTAQKITSFDKAYGTILFFEDMSVVEGLQKQFPLYSQNFPIWAEHANAMAEFAVWSALANAQIGASLQHYNPLIDTATRQEWALPASWKLIAQMPFGSIESPAGTKDFMPIEQRVFIKKSS